MFKKLIISLLLIGSINIYSENQKIYQIEEYSSLYKDLRDLHYLAGATMLTSSLPMSKSEIRYALSNLNIDNNDKTQAELLDSINSLLAIDDHNRDFSPYWEVALNLEGYLQTDKDNEFWLYDYHRRKPLVNGKVGFGIKNIFWSRLDLAYQKGMNYADYNDSWSNLSLVWNNDQTDIQIPYIALSSVGGDNWNISFGRDLLNYGNGKTGNLLLSGGAAYHDYFKATTFWKSFKYTFTFLHIEAIDLGEGFTDYRETELNEETDEVNLVRDRNKIKVLIDHAFEFRPFNNFSIALHEATVRGGTEITLPYLNPFMIIHNLALSDKGVDGVLGNSLLSLSASYTPIKRLNLYGEYVLDQLETPSEADRQGEEAGNGDPDAFGFLFGFDYIIIPEFALKLSGEYLYTNPHLYRGGDSWTVYGLGRLYHNLLEDSNDLVWDPLGHSAGPDVSMIMGRVESSLLKRKLDLGLTYYHIAKGDRNLWDPKETGREIQDLETPTGKNDYIRDIISIDGSYQINSHFRAYTQIDSLIIQNLPKEDGTLKDTTDFQFVFGLSYIL